MASLSASSSRTWARAVWTFGYHLHHLLSIILPAPPHSSWEDLALGRLQSQLGEAMHIVSYMIFKMIIGLQLHLFHQACHLLQRQEHPMLSKHLESNIYFEATFSGPPKYLGNKFSLQKIYQAFSDKPLGFSTWWLPFLLPAPSKVSYKTTMVRTRNSS